MEHVLFVLYDDRNVEYYGIHTVFWALEEIASLDSDHTSIFISGKCARDTNLVFEKVRFDYFF